MADFEVSGAYPSRVADVQSELQSQDVGNGVRGELLEHYNESAHDSMAFQLETVKQKETAEQIKEIKSISPWLLQAPAGPNTTDLRLLEMDVQGAGGGGGECGTETDKAGMMEIHGFTLLRKRSSILLHAIKKACQTKALQQETKFETQASINRIIKLPVVLVGYKNLFRYLCFVMLFWTVFYMQTQPSTSYTLISQLKTTLIQSDGVLVADVRSAESLFKYLVGEIEVVEVADEDEEDASATGTKKKKKKKRGKAGGAGAAAEVPLIPTLFSDTYYNLETKNAVDEGHVLEMNSLLGSVLLIQQRFERVPCTGSSYAAFYGMCIVDGVLDTEPFGIDGQWKYSPQHNGHTMFLESYLGTANVDLVKTLRADKWMDRGTKSLEIKFALYNRNLKLFATNRILFSFTAAGGLALPTYVSVDTVSLEPYVTPGGRVLLLLELLFTMLVGIDMGNILLELYSSYSRGHLVKWLCGVWNYLDLLNTLLFTYSLSLRLSFVLWVYSNPITLPTQVYPEVLEGLATLQRQQTMVNAVNALICLLVLFKYYDFQDRLKVMSDTLKSSWVNFYHFMIVFSFLFCGYAFIGYLLFGANGMFEYRSLSASVSTTFEMLQGNYDIEKILYLAPGLGSMFTISFDFLIGMVLINVLLAILVDTYTHSLKGLQNPETLADQVGRVIQYMTRGREVPGMYGTEEFSELLCSFHEEGFSEVSLGQLQQKAGPGSHVERLCVLLSKIDDAEEERAGNIGWTLADESHDFHESMNDMGFVDAEEIEFENAALLEKLNNVKREANIRSDIQAQWQQAIALNSVKGQEEGDGEINSSLGRIDDKSSLGLLGELTLQSFGSITGVESFLGGKSGGVIEAQIAGGGVLGDGGGTGGSAMWGGSGCGGEGAGGSASGLLMGRTFGEISSAGVESFFNAVGGGARKLGLPAIFEGSLLRPEALQEVVNASAETSGSGGCDSAGSRGSLQISSMPPVGTPEIQIVRTNEGDWGMIGDGSFNMGADTDSLYLASVYAGSSPVSVSGSFRDRGQVGFEVASKPGTGLGGWREQRAKGGVNETEDGEGKKDERIKKKENVIQVVMADGKKKKNDAADWGNAFAEESEEEEEVEML